MQPVRRRPWYRSVVVVIAMLVCCWPIGIPLMWLWTPWRPRTKLIVIAVVGTLGLLTVVLSSRSAPPPQVAAAPTATVAQATTVPTLVPTLAPTAQPSATAMPATAVPTAIPPTSVPATAVPATAVPPTPAPPKPAEVAKPSGPSPEVQAYLDWLQPKMDQLGQSSNALAAQFRLLGQTPALLLNNDWKLKTGIALGFMKNAGEEMKSQERPVPPAAVAVDRDVRSLGSDLVQIADEYAVALDRVDAQRLQRANERMQVASQKANALAPKVQALRGQ